MDYHKQYTKYKELYLHAKYGGLNSNMDTNIINKELQDILNRFNETESYGGILVAHNGNIIYEKYFDNTFESQFRIFSCTKPVCGIAIMILIDQNKLSIDDTLDKFNIGELPNANKITILHLLTHRSGIFDVVKSVYFNRTPIELFNSIYKPNENRTIPLSFEQYIKLINDNKPQYEPGEIHSYNDTGYDILGYIIYIVSGLKTTDFVTKYIFDPLDMTNSSFHTYKLKHEVLPYEDKDTVGVRENYNFFGMNANIITSLRDYNKFISNYGKLLTDKTLEIYSKLYYFKKKNYISLFNNLDEIKEGRIVDVFLNMGAGDFSHQYGDHGGIYQPLSKTLMIRFIDKDINIILHENYIGKNKLIEWHSETESSSMNKLTTMEQLILYFSK